MGRLPQAHDPTPYSGDLSMPLNVHPAKSPKGKTTADVPAWEGDYSRNAAFIFSFSIVTG